MSSKLWFVTNGVQVIAAFDDHTAAEQELKKYQDDPDFGYYDCYDVDVKELEDYPDEYDMALEEGLVG